MSSATCFSLDQSKILSSGNGLSPLLPEYVPFGSTCINVHDKKYPYLRSSMYKRKIQIRKNQVKSQMNIAEQNNLTLY